MHSIPTYVDVREVLHLLVRRFGLLQKDSAQCCGVTVLHSHILYEVHRRSSLSLNELADALCIDTSTLSRQVQQLVEAGLLHRVQDPKDRRYVVLTLTAEGEEQSRQIANSMQEYIAGLFQSVPDDKKAQVLESLRILSDAMSKSPNCCTPPL